MGLVRSEGLQGSAAGPGALLLGAGQVAGAAVGPIDPQPVVLGAHAEGERLHHAGRRLAGAITGVVGVGEAEALFQLIDPQLQLVEPLALSCWTPLAGRHQQAAGHKSREGQASQPQAPCIDPSHDSIPLRALPVNPDGDILAAGQRWFVASRYGEGRESGPDGPAYGRFKGPKGGAQGSPLGNCETPGTSIGGAERPLSRPNRLNLSSRPAIFCYVGSGDGQAGSRTALVLLTAPLGAHLPRSHDHHSPAAPRRFCVESVL